MSPKEINDIAEQLSSILDIDNKLKNLQSSFDEKLEKVNSSIRDLVDRELKELRWSMENRFLEAEKRTVETQNSIKSLNRKIKDIESDQRTTQAIGCAVLDSGVSFKGTRIPYPLQGNAAIEDIKDYY